MKKFLASLVCGILFILIGTFLITPTINDFYMSYKSLEPGPDSETELLNLLIFVEWPIYFIVGGILGYVLYIKYLTNKDK